MSRSEEEIVRFDNVGLRYGTEKEVLSNIAFSLYPGRFYFLTGASGAGKTSLLRLLYLAQRPSRGAIRMFGRDVIPEPREQLRDPLGPHAPHVPLAVRAPALAAAFEAEEPQERRGRAVRRDGERGRLLGARVCAVGGGAVDPPPPRGRGRRRTAGRAAARAGRRRRRS